MSGIHSALGDAGRDFIDPVGKVRQVALGRLPGSHNASRLVFPVCLAKRPGFGQLPDGFLHVGPLTR